MPRYWLIFEIGLSTSFEKLFSWLDDHKATECGDNAATFVTPKSYETVEKEIKTACRNGGGSRVYLIGPPKAPISAPVPTPHGIPVASGLIGRFVVGRRKASPWTGFGSTSPSEEGDDA